METVAEAQYTTVEELAHGSLYEQHANTQVTMFGITATIEELEGLCPVKDDPERWTPMAKDLFVADALEEAGVEIPEEQARYIRRIRAEKEATQEVPEKQEAKDDKPAQEAKAIPEVKVIQEVQKVTQQERRVDDITRPVDVLPPLQEAVGELQAESDYQEVELLHREAQLAELYVEHFEDASDHHDVTQETPRKPELLSAFQKTKTVIAQAKQIIRATLHHEPVETAVVADVPHAPAEQVAGQTTRQDLELYIDGTATDTMTDELTPEAPEQIYDYSYGLPEVVELDELSNVEYDIADHTTAAANSLNEVENVGQLAEIGNPPMPLELAELQTPKELTTELFVDAINSPVPGNLVEQIQSHSLFLQQESNPEVAARAQEANMILTVIMAEIDAMQGMDQTQMDTEASQMYLEKTVERMLICLKLPHDRETVQKVLKTLRAEALVKDKGTHEEKLFSDSWADNALQAASPLGSLLGRYALVSSMS